VIGLSDRTVDYHVENAMRKLGVNTRAQAAVKACAAKLIRIWGGSQRDGTVPMRESAPDSKS
jgi:hypothetical protein